MKCMNPRKYNCSIEENFFQKNAEKNPKAFNDFIKKGKIFQLTGSKNELKTR